MAEQRYAPRRRPRRPKSKFKRFVRRYSPTIMLGFLCICCICMVVFTATTISAMLGNRPSPEQDEPQADLSAIAQQVDALIEKADFIAAGYDYTGAIELLKTFPDYESQSAITAKISEYTQADGLLQPYPDLDSITHIFFHSLIVDPSRAFDGDKEEKGYNLYMVTIPEFKAILQSMYDRGYVLVSPYDIAYEVVDDTGARFEYGNIRLPAGKTPFLMSQDDVNYYGYMIGSGHGKDETPVFASTDGDGFASRIVIGEDGFPTCEYMDINGNVTTGDYDLVPVLESFIQEHPDFSYHGARAILGVTGYEGVFGYRTKPSYEGTIGTEAYQKEVEDAKAVAQCLRDHGWILASHSYGHPRYGDIADMNVAVDSDKWESTCESIIGEVDVLLYPNGSDIQGWRYNYSFDNAKFKALYEDGFRYFFNVDSAISWCQVGDNYFRASRRNIDGYRMFHHPEKLEDLFDVSKVFDASRPTPVPPIGGTSM